MLIDYDGLQHVECHHWLSYTECYCDWIGSVLRAILERTTSIGKHCGLHVDLSTSTINCLERLVSE